MVGLKYTLPVLKKTKDMAKLLYNLIAVEDTSTKWATNTTIYNANYVLIETDTGIMKQGNGVDVYADLGTLGAKQALTWADVTGKPSTFAPEIGTTATKAAAGNHDHAVEDITDFPETMTPSPHDHVVEADEASDLAEASTIQALAIALSTRIKALEDLASTD